MREKRRRPEDWEFISFFNLSIEFGVCTKTSFMTAPLHELGWQKRDTTIGPAFPLSSSPDDISLAKAGDWDGVRNYEVKGSNSYSKLVARYQRDLLALHAASESPAW